MIETMRKHGKHSAEYWQEYQHYVLKLDRDICVNSVSVLDPDFVNKVCYAIKADGIIRIEQVKRLS